ncbi:group II intron reverse transcriptase domain-containing protein [Patescibacteria group bacterium]|nr:group II intron reverse transcriptase domain-containing protein [Patescibacteria group bacterium]
MFLAWTEFLKGKRSKSDVQAFELHLEDNIFALHEELVDGTYRHGGYQQFRISDPKPRLISKASVHDRLLHHAIYRILHSAFDKTFIFDSYSCRKNKGTHKGFFRLAEMARKVSKNYTSPCWALELDIRKFFDSVDHKVLMELLQTRIADERLLGLLENIIGSFGCLDSRLSGNDKTGGTGMPLGNLTSQLFANVYLDPLDKFAKHRLRAKRYLRYADDFTLLADGPGELMGYFVEIAHFLKSELKLQLHPDKLILRKLSWGIDFIGYNALPHYNLPRRKTVKRICGRISREMTVGNLGTVVKAMPSYLGYLAHVSGRKITQRLRWLAGESVVL